MKPTVSGLAGMWRLTKSASCTAAAKSFVTRSQVIDRRGRRRIGPRASDHVHPVTERGDAGYGAADSAAPDHGERLAGQVAARGRCPRAACHARKRRRQVPRRGGNEQHGVLRNRLIENTRRVGAQQPPRGRARFVDAIMTDTEARDDSARGQRVVERSCVLTVPHDDVLDLRLAHGRRELLLAV